MSELKTYTLFTTASLSGQRVYLKSEADKVIAEKDETIDELKERNDELQKATDSAWSKVNAMYDELRHQKRERCLAMATFCHVSSVLCEGPASLFYRRWFHKWYELAERFKEERNK